MSLGCAAAVGASASAGTTVFQYNRKNYMYDREMRMETEFQIMEFRIERARLFRDDVRDIVGLTSVKMDTYLIINAVQLGFCVMMFCEGRLSAGTPNWLIGAHTLALAGAFTYLLMSVWLSMHAMVAARSYEVRLLTQLVRLPVPSWAQLEGARTYASTFEKLEARQMFRVPFVMGTQERVLGSSHSLEHGSPSLAPSEEAENVDSSLIGEVPSAETTTTTGAVPDVQATRAFSADPWGLELPGDNIYELDRAVQTDPRELDHVKLVRAAMQYWQSYDAFSRVSMSIGTNQLVAALSYYVLGYVLVANHAVVASWLGVTMFVAIACALIRLDMSLSASQYQLAVCLVACGPLCMAYCTRSWAVNGTTSILEVLVPITYLSQAAWLGFVLYVCNVREQANGVQLPTGFRSVLYIDVFGWIKDNAIQRVFNSLSSAPPNALSHPLPPQERNNGFGPAMEAVRYQDGRPEPMRVDQLPGAARATRAAKMSKAHFTPATFVPREKDSIEDTESEDALEAGKAGTRPWRVFGGATSLLCFLWVISGLFISMETFGWSTLRVFPIVRANEFFEDDESSRRISLLSLDQGHAIKTVWPHENVHTVGLACDSASDTLVASTRFGLYTANLQDQIATNALNFKSAPFCEEIEGEALQDVALQCNSGEACEAVVLNQHGRRLTKCNISERPESYTSRLPFASLVAEEWLADADVASKTSAESLQSLALVPSCRADMQGCAYVGTSDSRIVELQQLQDSALTPKWFPHRLLHSRFNATSSGRMSVIQGKYLGVLQLDGKHVSFLDLENGGAIVDSWTIPVPSKDHKWSAMCAAGDQLYFLSSGPSPQLSHFSVPERLHHEARRNANVVAASNTVARKHRTSQVSLSASSDSQAKAKYSLRR
eukprot:CAMPEP_0169095704 /NCGR_PEP_ID=MMETSP1015-20121227/18612_1 /TAXON_ID=342587 /ORGANISM="Karlodinium micrum, Strain CCMP2283" /LENGTH=889 /DNA_ID=CAMNT_0009156429 /DNA_START=51 /DNA_END=2717 /DNA_ORIENTATION=-